MLLVDSGAWVLFIRGEIDLQGILAEEDAAVCPPVIQEVLQGANTIRRYALARNALFGATILDAPMPVERFEEAAQLYVRCRARGITVRKSTACLIAAVALAHDVALLHRDRDFDFIGDVMPLRALRV